MSVAEFVALDKFTIRIYKNLKANPSITWVNNYEGVMSGSGDEADLAVIANLLLAYEQSFTLDVVNFHKLVVSTYEAEGAPYDPAAFLSIPVNVDGQRSLGAGQMLDLRCCWFVKRQVEYGRYGKLLYRGVLLESDVNSVGGAFVVTTPASLDSLLSAAMLAGDIIGGIVGTMEAPVSFEMKLLSNTVRTVNNLVSSGVAVAKLNHRYFDRPGA